jgi:pSer/pThr/pTyr-binding forkhead associated (FHA) protein
MLYWMRILLLASWSLIVAYLGSVAVNIYVVVARDAGDLANQTILTRALLLPESLTKPATPGLSYTPFLLVFFLLLGACSWAVRDVSYQRRVERLREMRLIAERVREATKAVTWATRDIGQPSLLIVPIDGSTPATHTPLTKDTITIGRDTTNDIVLPDPTVSRHEVRLTREGMLWRVARLLDAVPLYVNGRQQEQAVLRHCDQLVVGATILRFESPMQPNQTLVSEPVPYLVVRCLSITFAVALRDEHIILGRAPDCGIVVPSAIVSHHHAVLIRKSDGTYTVEDSGSRNGMRFDGKAVPHHTFRNRDTVTIGERSGVELVTLTYLTRIDPSEEADVEISGIT